MDTNKRLTKTNKIVRIMLIIFNSLLLCLMLYFLISGHIKDVKESANLSEPINTNYSLNYVIFVIIGGALTYGILIILGLLDLLIAFLNKKHEKRRKNILISSIFIIIPMFTYILLISIGSLFL